MMMEPNHPQLSVARQCAVLGLARSSYYYRPRGESAENRRLMLRLDELYTAHPFYGSPRLTACLRREGWEVNEKRVCRLMKKMGLAAIYPKRRLSRPDSQHRVYPYLLRGVKVTRPDQAWAADITYIRLARGFAYLVAVMDWFSRCVLAWELSNTLDERFCLTALEHALQSGAPEIFNTDQGSQFTGAAFTGRLLDAHVNISMDGRGRFHDNIFVERLWRSVKCEEVYLRDYDTLIEAAQGLERYFRFYNHERPHQSLGYRTPWEVYAACGGCAVHALRRSA